jgi:iron complex transport system substrate-binding protein
VTEVICALGLEANLVGVTSYCDRPASVRGKAVIGGPANPSLEAVFSLKPDLVVVDEEGIGPSLTVRLERMGVKAVQFHGSRLAGLADGIRRLGRDLGVPGNGERLAADIERALRPAKVRRNQLRVLYVIWPDPLITAGTGTAIDDALRIAGLRNCADDARGAYPHLSLETVLARNPDMLVVGPGHTGDFPLGKLLRRLASTRMVREGRICYVSDALYRSGPRIPEGIGELRRCADRFFPDAAFRQQGVTP